jgi:predicted Rossmann fold nucleotide-binding protein DprA/Smf involved in DNA uptake
MKRVIVAGSRDFTDYALLERKLDAIFLNSKPEEVAIISGGAQGADCLGERYAHVRSLQLIQVYARWNAYGRRVGYVRNKLMAEIATHLVAFWDGKIEGSGTKMMIDLAEQQGLPVRVIRF